MSQVQQERLVFLLISHCTAHCIKYYNKSWYLRNVLTLSVMFYLQASTQRVQSYSLLPMEKRLDSPQSSRCGSPEDSYVSFKTKKIIHTNALIKQDTFEVLT